MNFRAILKGTAMAAIIIFIVLIIAAVVNMVAEPGEKVIRIIVLLGMCVAVAFSSLGVSSGCEKMKLVNSLLTGLLVVVLITIVSLAVNHEVSSVRLLTSFICCMASAAFGTFISN